jgi:hypothetical protein
MSALNSVADVLERLSGVDPGGCRVVAGFDGFVDEMITLVGERRGLDDFTRVPDIAAFGAQISASAGHSSLREIVIDGADAGGCAVNLSDGLGSLGVVVDCFATLGEPVHGAFTDVRGKCRGFHSWGREPGRTLAFEFGDGKVMFSAVRQLGDFTPERVRGFLEDGEFARRCGEAQVIALTDWTLYPHMTDVWRMLQREVFGGLGHRPEFFIDLVDPTGRAEGDVRGMLECLRGFEEAGRVTLGLNGNEANLLCRMHGLAGSGAEGVGGELLDQAVALRDLLGIGRVVIHRARHAVSACGAGGFFQEAPFCEAPRKSTGAGDRFNAGFCLGLALGFGDGDCLVLGCGLAGWFVRKGASPSFDELKGFLGEWADGLIL